MSTDPTFGELLRSLREAAGLTQAALAERIGFTRQFVFALEKGTTQPTWETVRKLARALKVPVGAFDVVEPGETPEQDEPATTPPPPSAPTSFASKRK